MIVSKRRLILNYFALILMIICIIINQNGDKNRIVAVVTCLIGLTALIRVRKNISLLIIYGIIVYCNYSICAANYFFHIESFFTSYSGAIVSTYGLNLLLIFSTLLFWFAPYYYSDSVRNLTVNNKDNQIIFWGILVILVLIWIFGFTRPQIAGERGSPSAIYEYSIIFIIIAYYYSGQKRLNYLILVLTTVAFALQNFIFGGRITGVQLIICLYLTMFVDKISTKTVLLLAIPIFVLMNVIGEMRGRISLQNMNLSYTLESLKREMFALDTAYSSYHTSLTFLFQAEKMSITSRLNMFFKWILSLFLGGSVPDSNLAVYTRQYYMHYYGGVLPFFGKFYLGYPGVCLIGLYLKRWFKTIAEVTENSSGLIRCISVYLVTTCFRWYLYSPSQLFRGVMLLCVCYGACYQFHRLCKKE